MSVPAISIRVEALNSKIWLMTLYGEIDAGQSRAVGRALNEQFSLGHKRLILDLAQVDYISSDGLRILVGAWQRARESKGNLVLVGVKPRILEMLQIIGLDLVFPIAETQGQAIAHFTRPR
ncbi:MAG TPA: STAS domain-containing protein [Oceanobacillus sp.]|nr:STAS domain-containing protein [Oceanobacillus sp.]